MNDEAEQYLALTDPACHGGGRGGDPSDCLWRAVRTGGDEGPTAGPGVLEGAWGATSAAAVEAPALVVLVASADRTAAANYLGSRP